MITAKFLGSYPATVKGSKIALRDENNKVILHSFYELHHDLTNEDDVASMELYRTKQGAFYKESEEGFALWYPRADFKRKGSSNVNISSKGNVYVEQTNIELALEEASSYGKEVLVQTSIVVANQLLAKFGIGVAPVSEKK